MSVINKIKASWDAYIKRLGEKNKKEYGTGGVPDCCKMNKAQNDAAKNPRQVHLQ